MIIGCSRNRTLCFLHCTLVDRVKSCISFACALMGLPSGRQALTLTLTLTSKQPASQQYICQYKIQPIVPNTFSVSHIKKIHQNLLEQVYALCSIVWGGRRRADEGRGLRITCLHFPRREGYDTRGLGGMVQKPCSAKFRSLDPSKRLKSSRPDALVSLVLPLILFDAVMTPAVLFGLAILPLTNRCLQKLGVAQQ